MIRPGIARRKWGFLQAATAYTGWPMAFGQLMVAATTSPENRPRIIQFTDSLGRVWFGYLKSRAGGSGWRLAPRNRVRAMVFKWAPSWLFTDEARRFGLEVNLGWSSLTRDASATSLLWMTNGCAEFLESWKRPTEICWLNAISGIFHISKAEISAALKDSNHRVNGEHFGRREGTPRHCSPIAPAPDRH